MIHVRGNRADYDLWRQSGLEGWSFADVLPYFKKLESHWRGAGPYHGADGPIAVTKMEGPGLMTRDLRADGRCGRHSLVRRLQWRRPRMVSAIANSSIGRGRRQSTATTYLAQARGRSNLTIQTRALANRILLDTGRAIGIEYQHGNDKIWVYAKREVILSGGSYNSPQLLMLSGHWACGSSARSRHQCAARFAGRRPESVGASELRRDVQGERHGDVDPRSAAGSCSWPCAQLGVHRQGRVCQQQYRWQHLSAFAARVWRGRTSRSSLRH